MESTEKCEVVIQHFNGKYLKTPPGIPGKTHIPLSNDSVVTGLIVRIRMSTCEGL